MIEKKPLTLKDIENMDVEFLDVSIVAEYLGKNEKSIKTLINKGVSWGYNISSTEYYIPRLAFVNYHTAGGSSMPQPSKSTDELRVKLASIENKINGLGPLINYRIYGSNNISEKDVDYNRQMRDLLEFFDGKRLLSVADIMKYTGRDRHFVINHFGISDPKSGISIVVLARKLTEKQSK